MAHRFRRTRDGIEARLDEAEKDLLARLFDDVHDMLDDGREPSEDDWMASVLGGTEDVRTPDDPALARLLPDATRDDEDAAHEFRRFTEGGLRARKRQALRTARETLHRGSGLLLDDTEARSWVTALTDVRLVLGERLGVRTDADAERLEDLLQEADEDDPRVWLAAVYDFLTWLQETLVTVLLAALPEEGRGQRQPPPG